MNNINNEIEYVIEYVEEFNLKKGYTKEDLDILSWIEDKRLNLERKH